MILPVAGSGEPYQPVQQIGHLAVRIIDALRDDAIDDRAKHSQRRTGPQRCGRRNPRR
jgi:hypothetical protein